MKDIARVVKNKELVNTRLATNYDGWMYCDKCDENIGYLCYSTYDITILNKVKENRNNLTLNVYKYNTNAINSYKF